MVAAQLGHEVGQAAQGRRGPRGIAGEHHVERASPLAQDQPAAGTAGTEGHVAGRQALQPETARVVRHMLELATLPGGTAPKAQVVGYRVAGKTGTAHKVEGRGYSNRYISSFVGFAPVSNPRLIVAVMIDEPSAGQYYGGDVAAPTFSNVVGAALRTLGIPTDAPVNNVILPPDNAKIPEET